MSRRVPQLLAGRVRSRNPRLSNTEFGLSFGTGSQTQYANATSTVQGQWAGLLKSIGMKWCRLDASWSTVQPTSGASFDFTTPDKAILTAQAAGFNVLVVLFNPPTWAKPVGVGSTLLTAWEAYCTATVTHYAAHGIHAFEIWNEPNQLGDKQAGWGIGKVQSFATLLETGYTAIVAADAQATVVSGGVCPVNDPTQVTGDQRTGCSWPTQSAGASTLVVSSTAALTADFTAANPGPNGGAEIPGNYLYHSALGGYCPVVGVSNGVSWTLGPPGGVGTWGATTSHTGQTVNMLGTYMAPDYFTQYVLAQIALDGQPGCFHKWGSHPYSTPLLPLNYGLPFKGFTIIPTLVSMLNAAGYPDRQIWVTESGQNTGWPTASASSSASLGAATMTVTVSEPNANDVGYNIISTSGNTSVAPKTGGIPSGTTITAVNVGTGVYTLAAPSGSFPAAVTVATNDQLVIWDSADGVQIGVAFGSSEAQQALVYGQMLDCITRGATGTVGSGRYGRVQVLMGFCPTDSTDGTFGLFRFNLAPKAVVAAIQARIPART